MIVGLGFVARGWVAYDARDASNEDKFCGITRVDDAVAAARAGADALGLNFSAESPRRVSIDRAKEIIAAIPVWVTPVALFVDSPIDEILRVAGETGLRDVQLHGKESREIVAKLHGLKIIKVIHVTASSFETTIASWKNLENLSAILLDTASATAAGGTGAVNDWNAIASAQQSGRFTDLPPVILAGGLTSENVGEPVRRIKPFAVDVSSGIEISKGIKSVEKMNAFAKAVRDADLGFVGKL